MKHSKFLLGLKTGALALSLAAAIPFGVNAATVKSPDGPYLDESKMTEEEKEGYELTKKYEKTLPKINPNSNIPSKYFATSKKKYNKGELPSKYDSRTDAGHTVISPVKDQNITGTCWCFSLMEATQASLLSHTTSLSGADFAESQLAYFIYNNRDDKLGLSGDMVLPGMDEPGTVGYYDIGATDLGGAFATSKGIGLIPEEEAKFTDLIDNLHDDGKATLPEDYCYNKNTYTVSGFKVLNPKKQQDEIKAYIKQYGAGQISYFHHKECYDYSTYAFYTAPEFDELGGGGGHAVTVVGWDDNYSKDNFVYAPEGDGAWLIKNSWGDVWGLDGYFWISYYEPSLGSAIFYDVEKADDYDNIYQYDGTLAATTISGYEQGANVFTAVNDEILNAVSFFTVEDNTKFEVRVYTDVTDAKDPTSGKLEVSKTGSMVHMGYTKLDLGQEVKIEKGKKFSIVVKQTVDGKPADMFCDKTTDEYYVVECSNANAGESLAIKPGAKSWEDISADGDSNLRIKAFTKVNESAAGTTVSFKEDSYVVAVDEKIPTTVLLDGKEASGKAKFEYSVADEEIAFVDSAGYIHGRMVGETEVTVSYKGGEPATATVKVVKGNTVSVSIDKTDENYATASNPVQAYLGTVFNLKYTVNPSSYRKYVYASIETVDPDEEVDLDMAFFDTGMGYVFTREGSYILTLTIDDQEGIEGASQQFYVDVKANVVECGSDFSKIAANPYPNDALILYRYSNPDYDKYMFTLDTDIEEGFDDLYVVGLDRADITDQEIYDVVSEGRDDEVDEIDIYDVINGHYSDYTCFVGKPYVAFMLMSDSMQNGSFAVTGVKNYNPVEKIKIKEDDLVVNAKVGTEVKVPVSLLPEGCDADSVSVCSDDGRIVDAYYEDGYVVIDPQKVGNVNIAVGTDEAIYKVENLEDIGENYEVDGGYVTADVIKIDLTITASKAASDDFFFVDSDGKEIKSLSIDRNATSELKVNDDWKEYLVSYESSDNTVAYVDLDDILNGIGKGIATVKAIIQVPDEDGEMVEMTASLKVTVNEPDAGDINNLQTMHGYVKGTDEVYTYTSTNPDTECMNLYFDARTAFDVGDYITIQDGNGYYYGYSSETGAPITKMVYTESKLSDEFRFDDGERLASYPFTIYDNTVKIHFVSKAGGNDDYSSDFEDDNDVAADVQSPVSESYGFSIKRKEEGAVATDIKVEDLELDYSTYKSYEKRLKVEKVPANAIDKLYYMADDESIAEVSREGIVLGKSSGTAKVTVYAANPVNNVEGVAEVTVGEKSISGAKFYTVDMYGNKQDEITDDPATLEINVDSMLTLMYDTVPWNSSQDIIVENENGGAIEVETTRDVLYGDNMIDIFANEEGEYELKVYIPTDDEPELVKTFKVVVVPEPEPEIPEEYKTFSTDVFLQDGNEGIDPTEITEDEIRRVNYDDDESIYWTYKREGADYVEITFAKNSALEDYCDWIYIYDLDGNLVGRYTGNKDNDSDTKFAGMTIKVPGEGFILGFVSNNYHTDDGFRIVEIKPHFTKKDEPTPTPVPTQEPKGNDQKVTPSPSPSTVPTAAPDNTPKVGDTVKDASGKATYKILAADKVAFVGLTAKNPKSATIPATVTINGKKYKVTEIAANAFKNKKKLKKVTIGTNVTKINKNVFYGCKSLKTIIFKGKKLKTVGKNAIKGINKKAVIKAPKASVKAYKKKFTKKTGFKKTMKIKKK